MYAVYSFYSSVEGEHDAVHDEASFVMSCTHQVMVPGSAERTAEMSC